MRKRFYFNNEFMCEAKCNQSLGSCPVIQYAHEHGLEHNLGIRFNCQYVWIETFRHPEITEVRDMMAQICQKCVQRIRD